MNIRNQYHRHRTKRANQHGEPSANADGMSTPDVKTRQPAPGNAAEGGADVHNDERQPQVLHVYVETFIEIFWQPKKIEPPHRVGCPLRQRKSPGARAKEKSLISRRYDSQRNGSDWVAEPGMKPIVGKQQPGGEPQQTESAGSVEGGLPPKTD